MRCILFIMVVILEGCVSKTYSNNICISNASKAPKELYDFCFKKAQSGEASAMHYIAEQSYYFQNPEKSVEEIIRLYVNASDKGHIASASEAGHLAFEQCTSDIEPNEKMCAIAVEQLGRAEKAFDPDGAFYLAWMYAQGVGVKKDLNKALRLFQKAKKLNHDYADALIKRIEIELDQK